jgi:signal transduction histidine kinase
VDLSALARRIVDRLRAAEPSRSVDVNIDATPTVLADRGLMEVVLDNLLSNAWKYSSKRELARIEFACVSQGGENVFSITDNGAGFDPKYAQRLFVPFSRLHDSRDFPGIGIGLATVQRVIERHGGRIWAQSDGQSGAQFFFTIGQSDK